MRLVNLCSLTLLLSFVLLLLGPLIQFDKAQGLVCNEWPLCFGEIFPTQIQGRGWLEYAHRFLASIIGFLSALMVVLAYQAKNSSKSAAQALKPLSMAFFFVLIQGGLGGLTVVYKLPTLISTAHMFFSLVYLLYLQKAYMELRFEPELLVSDDSKAAFKSSWNAKWRDSLFSAFALVLISLLLNSLVRQTGSLRVCGTGFEALWTCQQFGGLWPFTLDASPSARLHMTYRFFALLSSALAFWSCLRLGLGMKRASLRLAIFSFSVAALVVLHFFMGPIVLVSHFSLPLTIVYLATGLVSLGALWVLFLSIQKLELALFKSPQHTLFSDLLELTKPRLSALVMVTAWVGMMMAPAPISLFQAAWALILIAAVVTGACALNCYMEKEVDKQMERTRFRSLPSGRMRASTALSFGLVLLFVSLPLLAMSVNILTAFLAFIAAILYLLAYTPMKRKSELALYVGAIPGALPPMMGWSAVMNDLSLMAWALFFIMFIWQLPHFLAISVFHAKDYARAGIKVYPNQRGAEFTKANILLGTLLLFAASLVPALWGGLGQAYQVSALIFGAAFTLLALAGYFLDKSDVLGLKVWARRYFLGSIFYLPLLMGSMIFFR